MILTFIFVLSCVTLNAVASYRVVCVYTNWSQYRPEGGTFLPEDIDPSLCTHVIYVYAKIQGNKLMATEWNDEGSSWSDGMYDRVNNLKQINPEMKTLLGVGGWTMGSKDFSRISARRGSRRTFAISTIKFLRDRNFDGLTIDWQNPTERGGRRSDKNNFSKLLRDIRSAFTQESKKTGKPSLMLTIGVSANKKTIDNAYEIDKITKYIDFMNVLAYDLHGSWDNRTGHPSQLYPRKEEVGPSREINVHTAMKYWISKVPDRSKLILGISTYGRTFTLKNPKYHVLMVPTKGPGIETEYTKQAGMISYYERCSQYFDATRVWDKQGRVAYWYQGNQWIGLEDEESVREKVRWAKRNQLGGASVWSMDTDDFGEICSNTSFPLIRSVIAEFEEIAIPEEITTTTTTPEPATTDTFVWSTEYMPVEGLNSAKDTSTQSTSNNGKIAIDSLDVSNNGKASTTHILQSVLKEVKKRNRKNGEVIKEIKSVVNNKNTASKNKDKLKLKRNQHKSVAGKTHIVQSVLKEVKKRNHKNGKIIKEIKSVVNNKNMASKQKDKSKLKRNQQKSVAGKVSTLQKSIKSTTPLDQEKAKIINTIPKKTVKKMIGGVKPTVKQLQHSKEKKKDKQTVNKQANTLISKQLPKKVQAKGQRKGIRKRPTRKQRQLFRKMRMLKIRRLMKQRMLKGKRRVRKIRKLASGGLNVKRENTKPKPSKPKPSSKPAVKPQQLNKPFKVDTNVITISDKGSSIKEKQQANRIETKTVLKDENSKTMPKLNTLINKVVPNNDKKVITKTNKNQSEHKKEDKQSTNNVQKQTNTGHKTNSKPKSIKEKRIADKLPTNSLNTMKTNIPKKVKQTIKSIKRTKAKLKKMKPLSTRKKILNPAKKTNIKKTRRLIKGKVVKRKRNTGKNVKRKSKNRVLNRGKKVAGKRLQPTRNTSRNKKTIRRRPKKRTLKNRKTTKRTRKPLKQLTKRQRLLIRQRNMRRRKLLKAKKAKNNKT